MRWIAITPADRLRRLVVVTDVATNLPREVWDRREDASGQEVALDLGKPQLDLVEPRRVGRREMQVDVRMVQQKGAHRLRLVRRQVVRDHMNFTALRLAGYDLAQEVDKRGAGVARHGLAEHFAGFRVERREQRQRTMPVILE